MLRLLIGGISLGVEEIRAHTGGGQPPALAAGAAGPTRRAGISPVHVLAGLAAGSIAGLSRAADDATRTRLPYVRNFGERFPLLGLLVEPLEGTARRAQDLLQSASDAGRREEARGRALVDGLVNEVMARSIKNISEQAVREITHNPDVAALLRAQSTNLISETLLDVRENSEHADDEVERRVRRWLHIGRAASARPGAHGSDGKRPAVS